MGKVFLAVRGTVAIAADTVEMLEYGMLECGMSFCTAKVSSSKSSA